MNKPEKILLIGNYPPPMCGWAIQTKLTVDELRRRGHFCEVLKINENRQVKSPEYVDVQHGLDYLRKVWRYASRGYRFNVHVNGMSNKGYWLAMAAVLTGRVVGRPALVTFHGGLSQNYFPRYDRSLIRLEFSALFHIAGEIACDSTFIKAAIEKYGLRPNKVKAIPTFSLQYMQFQPVKLPPDIENFLQRHQPVIFSYVSFRPEYRLEVMREGMIRYRERYPNGGFIWLGFPGKEFPAAEEFVKNWPKDEREGLLLLGNVAHDEFLTLLARSLLNLRTPACDGVSASVLESLALGVPVVASENGKRPAGVLTYADTDATDMCQKLVYATENYEELTSGLRSNRNGTAEEDNIKLMADWLSGVLHSADDQHVPAPAQTV